ncbi:hypothetical protein NDU88_003952 [Pleurodeles waltl]|uniref:Uncharacterized protein n=1 Tax=Pleurodeles waltl TaxID=8319 RepID=A0AAV7SHF2_PLEWA|nr:hypothetical protein NDU88_003952 [Pleurodeles waltl]
MGRGGSGLVRLKTEVEASPEYGEEAGVRQREAVAATISAVMPTALKPKLGACGARGVGGVSTVSSCSVLSQWLVERAELGAEARPASGGDLRLRESGIPGVGVQKTRSPETAVAWTKVLRSPLEVSDWAGARGTQFQHCS